MFFFVKQKKADDGMNVVKRDASHVFRDILDIWKERKMHRNFFLLVLAFFFYNDALSTLFAFVAIFAQFTIGMTIAEITTLMFVVQLLAFPASWFFGALADIIGQKTLFFIAICLASLGIGASQSSTRAMIRQMIPHEHGTKFFGFQSFLGKFSAFLGPLAFGFLSNSFQNQRIAFVSIAFFLIVGMILLIMVKHES